MKILAIFRNADNPDAQIAQDEETDWYQLTDSNVLQGTNPFFVPDFAGEFEAVSGIGVRIGKLGKGIANRFAGRYYSDITGVTSFRPYGEKKLLNREIIFDRSFGTGTFIAFPSTPKFRLESETLELLGKRETGASIQIKGLEMETEQLKSLVDSAIERISVYNTLKTGDIVAILFPGTALPVREGMRLEIRLNGERNGEINIR